MSSLSKRYGIHLLVTPTSFLHLPHPPVAKLFAHLFLSHSLLAPQSLVTTHHHFPLLPSDVTTPLVNCPIVFLSPHARVLLLIFNVETAQNAPPHLRQSLSLPLQGLTCCFFFGLFSLTDNTTWISAPSNCSRLRPRIRIDCHCN